MNMIPFIGGVDLETEHIIMGVLGIVALMMLLAYYLIGGFSFAANAILGIVLFAFGASVGYAVAKKA